MTLVLMVLACVLLALAAFGVGTARVHLGWLGLAVFVLAGFILPDL